MTKILTVCLGNICRSPAAEGVLRTKSNQRGLDIEIDSAGTGAWHKGSPPDARMIRTTKARGYNISDQRARQVDLSDFYAFDILLAMDSQNYADLVDLAPHNKECEIKMFLGFLDITDQNTPDPYYGGDEGFENVLSLIEQGADGFLDYLAGSKATPSKR